MTKPLKMEPFDPMKSMEPRERLAYELAMMLESWLGTEPEERLRKIQMVADEGEKGHPVVILLAEDYIIHLDAHKFHSRFLGEVEWVERDDGPPEVGIPKQNNGTH